MKKTAKLFGIAALTAAIVLGVAGCDLDLVTSGHFTITRPGEWPPSNARPGDVITIAPGDLDMREWRIPAGTFPMGSPPDEIGRHPANFAGESYEGPQRLVTISADFWMSETPITQVQWYAVMGSNPSWHNSNAAPGERQERRPVENVSWYEVLVFANLLSKREGLSPAYMIAGSTDPADWGPVPTSHNALWNAVVVVEDADGWRLPTEAQWEYAARAGTIEAFSNRVQDHRDHAALDPIGWFPFNRGEWNTTREVGRKQPNPWGLYDMHGNVEEWVWDWLGQYPSIAETDPTGASPTGNNPSRAIRGNEMAAQTLVDGERFNRSASRNGRAPFVSWPFTGFRLVRP